MIVRYTEGDTAPNLRVTIYDNTTPVPVASISSVKLLRRAWGVEPDELAMTTGASPGEIIREWDEGDLTRGDWHVQYEVTFTDGKVRQYPSAGPDRILVRNAIRSV